MPKSDNQKARITAIYQLLKKYTDKSHGLTKAELITLLEKEYEINTTRQTIDSDFALLENPLGITINASPKRPVKYSLEKRDLSFEDMEHVVESIQLNTLLSEIEQRRIIKQLKENLCSIHEAKELSFKSISIESLSDTRLGETCKETIQKIDQAIESKSRICFVYPYYNYAANSIKRTVRIVYATPLYRFIHLQKYYLCVSDVDLHKPRCFFNWNEYDFLCFEIGRIQSLKVYPACDHKSSSPDILTIRNTFEICENSFLPHKKETVTMICDNNLLDIIYDRFGKNIKIKKDTKKTSHITVDTEVSPEFLGWVFSLGTGIKILTPLYLTQRIKRWIESLSELYDIYANTSI